NARDVSLATQFAFSSYFPRDTGHFGGKAIKLVHHRVDGVLQLKEFATNVDGDFAGEIAGGDRDGHVRDVTNLAGEVRCHAIDVVGEVLPSAGDSRDISLASKLAFSPDFTRHASHFGREPVKLVDHRVDGVFQFQNFAFGINGNFLREIPFGYGGSNQSDVT